MSEYFAPRITTKKCVLFSQRDGIFSVDIYRYRDLT